MHKRAPLIFTVALLAVICCLPLRGQPGNGAEIVVGDYEGVWTTEDGKRGKFSGQIRDLGEGMYDGFLLFQRSKTVIAALHVSSTPGSRPERISLVGATVVLKPGSDLLPNMQATGFIYQSALLGAFTGDLGPGRLEARHVKRVPPGLEKKPPRGAIVLFDGRPNDHWEKFSWPITAQGALQTAQGHLRAKDHFSNYTLHLEFRVPSLPKARGQDRAQSGLILQNQFEIQILDSFGVFPVGDQDCGALYQVQAPVLNACLPPLAWQTLDVTYRQPHKNWPVVTAILNGKVVLDHVKILPSTRPNPNLNPDPNPGFLALQGGQAPVEFRNIWVRPVYTSWP